MFYKLINFILLISFVCSESQPKNTDNSEQLNDQAPHWQNPKSMVKTLYVEPAGGKISLPCKVNGAEPMLIRWYKNDKLIEKHERMGEYKFRRKSQVLVLETVVLSDKGIYRCVVNNSYGSINHTFQLDVTERSASPPLIDSSLLFNQTVEVGGQAKFQCIVYSDTHPHLEWMRIRPGSNGSKPTILKEAGVNTSDAETLIVRNVTHADAGEYSCVAGNSIGIRHVSAWLTVVDASSAPVVSMETEYIVIIIIAAVAASTFLLLVMIRIRSRSHYKDAPRLIAIENPDCIPPMTRMEEPLMWGVEGARWMGDETRIQSVQPDLQWELKQEDVHLIQRIDEGFFGLIYKAEVNRKGGGKADAAVKMLKATSCEKDVLDILSEMEQMKRVGRHKNIVNLLGVCTQNGLLWLVTEFAQQGNLRDYLRRNRPQDMQYHLVDPNAPAPRSEPLSQKDLMSSSYQVARGMEYLAQKKCVHRDLAARNVLVTNDYVMKIADFGLARDLRCQDYYRKNTRGHLPYKWMAPESLTDHVFTHSTDVWSFGVLLWEVFTLGGSPYPGVKTQDLLRLLRQGERLDHPQFASLELYRLLRDCWEDHPQRRPTFRQLVEDLDRMLAESSSLDYIDLTHPVTAEYEISDSEESGIADEGESSRESVRGTGDESDSVFDRSTSSQLTVRLEDVEEDGPLLSNDIVTQQRNAYT